MHAWLKDRKIGLMVFAGLMFIAGAFGSDAFHDLQSRLSPVEEPFPCTDAAQSDFQCYKRYYTALTKKSGVAAAIADVKDAYARVPYVASQCHQLTHVIGNTAYLEIGDIGNAFLGGDSFCWSGYYHGVVEEAVRSEGSARIKTHLDDQCAKIPGKERYSFDYYNCVHGLGHGVMAMTSNELFESLRLCDTMTGDWERSSCYGGVFMENVMADYRGHKTKYLKEDDLLYPCTAVEEQHKFQCYLMQTSYVLKKNGYDFTDVFKRCAAVPAPYDAVCGQSAGRDASGLTISNKEETKKRCDLAPSALLYHNCIIGAVKDFVSYFHSDLPARGFCAILERGEKESCDETVTSYYSTFAK